MTLGSIELLQSLSALPCSQNNGSGYEERGGGGEGGAMDDEAGEDGVDSREVSSESCGVGKGGKRGGRGVGAGARGGMDGVGTGTGTGTGTDPMDPFHATPGTRLEGGGDGREGVGGEEVVQLMRLYVLTPDVSCGSVVFRPREFVCVCVCVCVSLSLFLSLSLYIYSDNKAVCAHG